LIFPEGACPALPVLPIFLRVLSIPPAELLKTLNPPGQELFLRDGGAKLSAELQQIEPATAGFLSRIVLIRPGCRCQGKEI